MERDIKVILQKLKNDNPDIIYLTNISKYEISYNPSINDPKIINYEYETLLGSKIQSTKFKHEIIVVDRWDKNAVYYFLSNTHFPNAKTIIMNSHPCEYNTLTRSPNWQWIALYDHKWYKDFENIKVVEKEDYQAINKAIKQIEKKYTTDSKGKLIPLETNFFTRIYKNFMDYLSW